MFPPVTTWTGVNFGKFAKPAKAAKIQSHKISQMDYWLVVSTILKILVNGVGMTSHK